MYGQGLSCTELLTTICALDIDFEIDIVIIKKNILGYLDYL